MEPAIGRKPEAFRTEMIHTDFLRSLFVFSFKKIMTELPRFGKQRFVAASEFNHTFSFDIQYAPQTEQDLNNSGARRCQSNAKQRDRSDPAHEK